VNDSAQPRDPDRRRRYVLDVVLLALLVLAPVASPTMESAGLPGLVSQSIVLAFGSVLSWRMVRRGRFLAASIVLCVFYVGCTAAWIAVGVYDLLGR
jgi:hypothetical protein